MKEHRRRKRNTLCHLLVATTGKWTQFLLSTWEPHAQILTGTNKYSERLKERDGEEFD